MAYNRAMKSTYLIALGALIRFSSYAAVTNHPSSLRTYVVRPAVHEYIFKGTAAGSGNSARCAFNHLSGRTEFVKIGSALGADTLIRHEPRTHRVPDETLGIDRNVSVDHAVFQRPDGSQYTMVENEPFELGAGHMACLVDLESGWFRYVMDGDTAKTPVGTLQVKSVGSRSVTGALVETDVEIAWASMTEREQLAGVWRRHREERETRLAAQEAETRAEAEARANALAAARAARRAARAAPQRPAVAASMGVGTIYSFPVEYDVLPMAVRDANGRWITTGVAVPTRFERRMSGMSIHLQN